MPRYYYDTWEIQDVRVWFEADSDEEAQKIVEDGDLYAVGRIEDGNYVCESIIPGTHEITFPDGRVWIHHFVDELRREERESDPPHVGILVKRYGYE